RQGRLRRPARRDRCGLPRAHGWGVPRDEPVPGRSARTGRAGRDRSDCGRARMTALVLAERDGQVGICVLNRPERRNALSTALLEELVAALDTFDADPEVRAIVIRGEGPAFAA